MGGDFERWQRETYDRAPPPPPKSNLGCAEELKGFAIIILGIAVTAAIIVLLISSGVIRCMPMVTAC